MPVEPRPAASVLLIRPGRAAAIEVTEPEAVRRLLGALGLAAQPPPGRSVTAS